MGNALPSHASPLARRSGVPWKENSLMSQRHELVVLAIAAENGAGGDRVNVRELCRRRRISPKTLYKWIKRYKAGGFEALADRPRTPHSSPARTRDADEAR